MTAADAGPGPPQVDEGRDWTLWIIGGIALILVIIGLITYGAEKKDQESQQKAAELTAKFKAAGLRVPVKQDTIIRTLGTDGGPVCDNPGKSLGKAILFDQLTNGGSFVGRRPIIADPRLLQGELLILQTYCPDKVDEFTSKFKDVKTDNVIKD